MGIVACDAGEARIAFSPAFAAFQPIGLRFSVGGSFDAGEFYVPPGGVAGTTEIDGIRGAKLGGVEDRTFR